jgi:hypothetical protein
MCNSVAPLESSLPDLQEYCDYLKKLSIFAPRLPKAEGYFVAFKFKRY